MDLMNAVDEYVPTPVRELDKPFLMPIEDVFSIKGRGTVVTGRIERGRVKVNDAIEIVGIKILKRLLLPVLRCFENSSTKGKRETMLEYFFAV